MNKIDSFRGDYAFLSNDYPCNIEFDSELYPSLEHAFQAAKTDDLTTREQIKKSLTAADAKSLGHKVNLVKVNLVKDWDNKRLDIMADLLKQKFTNNIDLKIKLLMTGGQELVQSNMWKDKFWGVDRSGQGENNLGKSLMKIRDYIRASEGGPASVLSTQLSSIGLNFLGDSLKDLMSKARAVVDCDKSDSNTVNNASEELNKILGSLE